MSKSKHAALRKALGGGYYVPINLNVVDLVGSYEAAALLTRAIYWQDIAGGEFYKTNDEWIDELRLTEWQLREAKKSLAEYMSVIKKGMPAQNYYYVDMDALERSLASGEEASAPVVRKPQHKSRQSHSTSREKSSALLYKTNDTTNDTTKSDVATSDEQKPLTKKPIDQKAYDISDHLDRLVAHRVDREIKSKTTLQRDKAALEVERLHRIDGRSYEQIEGIMRWSQQDSFWRDNIQSTPTLRKKFDQLYAKAKSEHEKKQSNVTHIS